MIMTYKIGQLGHIHISEANIYHTHQYKNHLIIFIKDFLTIFGF